MVALKNIQPEQVLSLAGQVTAQPGQIVSRTLAQTPAVSLTLFAFAKGEEISTHESRGDALVQVLEGVGRFTVDGVGLHVPGRRIAGHAGPKAPRSLW